VVGVRVAGVYLGGGKCVGFARLVSDNRDSFQVDRMCQGNGV